MSPSVRQPTKKQLEIDALNASLESRWEDALGLNDQIIERFPRNAEAYNRKGRAYIELRRLTDARDAYSEALKADPANMIARRNLQRLELLYNREGGNPEGESIKENIIPRTNVFVEEIGKTWVDELAKPADVGVLSEVSPGDKLTLQIKGRRVSVLSQDGVLLGEVDMRIGARIVNLSETGNEFEAYALGISAQSLRIILRETFRSEDNEGTMTFPRQTRATQDLMRERDLLSQREESDFDFGEDDEDDDPSSSDGDHDEEDDPKNFISGNMNNDDEPEEM